MVPSREIIDDTAVVNDGTAAVNQRTTSYCEPVVESTVRSIRSVNTKDVSDGKATPTEDIKVTGKAGDLALGTEAGNETETNGTEASTETKLKGDSINSMTDANITSIVGGDGAGFQDSSDLATKNELWHLTEEHVWPAMLAEAEKIALDHKKASDIDIAKILAVPQAAQFAEAMQHTFKAIGAEIHRRIVKLAVYFAKLLPAGFAIPDSQTSTPTLFPDVADAFMLSTIGDGSVSSDWDPRRFKCQPFNGNPNDYERFISDALDHLGSCFGTHADEDYSLADEAKGHSAYGYVEQDGTDASFFYPGMATPLPLPGVAPPAGGHPPGTPTNPTRVLLLKLSTRRKKALASFLTQHVIDQNLKSMLQNLAPGNGGEMFRLLRQHCFRPINDLTVHELKETIASLSFDSVEVGRTANSLNTLVQILHNLNHKLPDAHRLTESELVEKVLRCISGLGGTTPLAHDARQELAANPTERRFWVAGNPAAGVAGHRSLTLLLEKLEPMWRETHKANGIPRRRDAGANQRADAHLVDEEDDDALAAGAVRGRRNVGRLARGAQAPVRKQPVSEAVLRDLIRCFNCQGLGHSAKVCPSELRRGDV